MTFLRLTCKEATALLVAREDRALPPLDRLALRLHLRACRACPVVERQLLTMRNAMRQWRNQGQGQGQGDGHGSGESDHG